MSKKDDNMDTIIIGAVIGGILGIGATMLFSSQKSKTSSLGMIGKTLAQVGEMIDEKGHQADSFIHNMEEKVKKEENTILAAVQWIATGISLWNKIKKGE